MPANRNRGFALAAVLWMLVAVGTAAVVFQDAARAERRTVANVKAGARARWAARAALARTLATLDGALGRSGAAVSIIETGEAVLPAADLALNRVHTRTEVRDARARLNLNSAEKDELERLFAALGLATEGSALADRILDWRDPDELRRPLGAERADYERLRTLARPADGPLEDADELRDVLGVTSETYGRVRPYVAAAGDGRVNVNAAAVPVLATLPGLDLEAAGAVAARRASAGAYRNPFDLLAALPADVRERVQADLGAFIDRVAFGPRDIEILVTAADPAGPITASHRARVRLVGGSVWSLEEWIER